VVEHDMDLIGELCDPVIVMAQGEKIAEGPMRRSGPIQRSSRPISARRWRPREPLIELKDVVRAMAARRS
jgi:energy-coupling factor transporter ATP-binding protein EcfA2